MWVEGLGNQREPGAIQGLGHRCSVKAKLGGGRQEAAWDCRGRRHLGCV